ncbi:CHAP domain-containing protein [Nonomuraea sp. NPDC050310]|uniref:CHAP domain-containing protein n=1 Tax=Nonomuraea sp. NPDC050310 TaxID=3154935 RepID=UPI0033FAFBDC
MSGDKEMLAAAVADLGMAGRPNPVTREYAARHGNEYLEAPWCQMGVTRWAHKSGNAAAVLPAGDRAYTVWHAEDGARLGLWHPGTAEALREHARPGAVIYFDWAGTDRRAAIDHVGIVERNLGDGRVQTIEANTGDACKRRVRGPSVIAGFWNPPYEKEDDVGAKEMWQHELKVPFGSAENPSWQAGNLLVNAVKLVLEQRKTLAELGAKVDAQTAAIQAMAEAMARQDSEIDVEALVARIQQEIGRIQVRLDVSDA